MYDDEDLLALSGLQHLAFCERQWALIHVEQVWDDSADTLRGDFFHERVDLRGYSCAKGKRAERRVHLVSRELGLYGVADLVEFGADTDEAPVAPVEYKVGRPKVDDWDRVQLAAQAICLEEMYGVEVPQGYLFYGETRRRERVGIDANLRSRVNNLTWRMHSLFASGHTPTPVLRPHCRRCSLLDSCLPGAARGDVAGYWAEHGEALGDMA